MSARKTRTAASAQVTLPVVVRDLAMGHRLTASDLRMARWPPDLAPAAALRHIEDVTGRRLAGPLGKGETVTSARLLGRGLTAGLPPGQVAVPVLLSDPHATDLLHPGDRADLLAVPATPDLPVADRAPGLPASVTVAGGHLLVLAVLPGGDDSGAELVVAADRPTALRIARLSGSQALTAVGVPP